MLKSLLRWCHTIGSSLTERLLLGFSALDVVAYPADIVSWNQPVTICFGGQTLLGHNLKLLETMLIELVTDDINRTFRLFAGLNVDALVEKLIKRAKSAFKQHMIISMS